MELKSNECVGKCDWKPAVDDGKPVEREGQPIFECGGCGSEWAPSEEWTPKNADGVISPKVAAARMQSTSGAPTAAPQAVGQETAGQPQNDSADEVAAPAAGEPTDIPPVIEAQADGVDAPANDSADTQAAPLKGDTRNGGGGSQVGSW